MLTPLPNRNVFNEFCEYESSLISGYSFVIDIDNFKELNDKYGHNFGDLVIVELSNFLKLKFKESYIFRISGDEFYGLLLENIENICNKLDEIKKESPLFIKYNLSYSVGLHKKELDENIQISFKYADMALFKAKKTKGIKVVLADEDFIREKERELKILELLEGDLEDLYAVYQPKVKISSSNIIGIESLVRCYSKELVDIYPNELIPIAENFDLIHKIDYKIAEESVKFVKELLTLNMIDDDFRISFNLSVKTFFFRNKLICFRSNLS
nr:diguanylate cyclase [uncultured Cetobacterium sp.]